ncbi:MAG: DUF4197 domain-containing protein [Desulfotalea sp.]
MKKFSFIISAFLVLGMTNPVFASNSWLDTGLNIIKSQSKTKNTKDEEAKAVNNEKATSPTKINNRLTSNEMSQAFKEALLIGSDEVVKSLGQINGFNDDAAIHIPLPENIQKAKSLLDTAGFSSLTSDLELKLNRAAEAATPKAKELFVVAISEMSFEDVMTIYQGPKDSATTYFREKMSPSLAKEMKPIVDDTLADVGALQAYDSFVGEYKTIPFLPDLKTDLTGYVVEKGMDGIFYYLAEKEIAIRENPIEQTTDLLKKVFGAN